MGLAISMRDIMRNDSVAVKKRLTSDGDRSRSDMGKALGEKPD